ncbi:MAG TPA: S8 family serine peptidase [Verrucomicrobiae bacterium]|nr:S8 family serine peptidase [Verrucomicrobiae bacterium]
MLNRFRPGRRYLEALAISLVWAVALSAWSSAPKAHPKVEFREGEVLVTFRESTSLDSAEKLLSAHKVRFDKHYAEVSRRTGRYSGLVRAPGRSTASLIAELSTDPAIAVVEPNYLRWASARVPNDALFAQMWALQNDGLSINGMTGTSGVDVRFLTAWSMARASTTPFVVAVIDTGIDYKHPDLAANIWTNKGEIPGNGVDDDNNGYSDDVHGFDFADGTSDPSDSGFHGTHVAGTIAAVGNNQVGVIGVAYHSQLMALRASSDGDSFPESAIIEAVDYATMMKGRGVNIVAINASFGGGGSNNLERAAIQAAGDAGIIFCAAAGNSSADHDVSPDYPSSYRLPNMISVAASTSDDQLADFSDYGATTVDLAAPGQNILSARPTALPGYRTFLQQGFATYAAEAMTYSGSTTGITATVYDCGLGYDTNFPAGVRNNIALIGRGTITFAEKVTNAMAAGARAAVIYNNASGNFAGTLLTAGNWIPAVSLAQEDAMTLKALLPATATVVNTADYSSPYQFLDGTSMAAPHVTGAVAFAAMNFPGESVAERVQRILNSADPTPGLRGKVRTGGRLNLARVVDADANGLPDWWELNHFGHLTGTDPNADPDGDGASNLAEWLAGTDPLNQASVLRVFPGSLPPTIGSTEPTIKWPSVAGKVYRLERATNLLSGFNFLVRTNIAATPPLNSETDTNAPPATTRYYRIEIEQ